MDVAAWLRSLGLERYAAAFRANDVEADVLLELTAEDLIALGVPSVGHRRKLFEAIDALRAESSAGAGGPSAATKPNLAAATAAPRPPAAERRQLTVLFCDVVGFTALAAERDPEDTREILQSYHRCVAEVVGRFEGHVAKYLGDGVIAYFGYPHAHEDNAERATRAGLQIIEEIRKLRPQPGLTLRVRVGIATGPVVVGEMFGEGATEVAGEAPNLAARLQALAEPGTLLISSGTRRLVAGLFDLAALGPQDLKGFAAPVSAWRVLGPSAAAGRFAARQAAGLTPLVGRAAELALLLRRWQRATRGEGQVVLLGGEPGIGKSRLVRTLRERLIDEAHTPLRYQGSPYHTGSALYPVVDQLERAAGFTRDDAAPAQLAKLARLLGEGTAEVAAALPLIADLLAVPTGERYPPLDLMPQHRKRKLFEVLLAQLQGLAAKRPVLMVVEDGHWLDPTTAELLGLAVERVQSLPVLLLVTHRPGFTPPGAGHGHVTALALERLAGHEAAAMVERVAGKALPADVVAQIAARTDGVPLFVEELTKAVLESELLQDEGARYTRAGPLPQAIPATLQDSLMARLDRLGPIKEVAQIAAVIGRAFSHELLAAVAPWDAVQLADALERLVAAALIFRQGKAAYRFKHALLRDLAYESLLRDRRRALHAGIAAALEERFPETVETEPDLLAHHYAQAGLVTQAVLYRYRAGRRAMARSATAEAAAQLTQGLELVAHLADGPERRRRELELQVALGGALVAARGYAAPEVGQVFARACELCRELRETPQLVPALYGRYLFHLVRAEFAPAHEVAEELLRLARDGDPAALVMGHRARGNVSLSLGRFAVARTHLERALALYDASQQGSSGPGYVDPRVGSLQHLAWALFALGHPDQALARSRAGLHEAERLSHPNTRAYALFLGCAFQQLVRHPQAAAQQAEDLIVLAETQGFPLWLAGGRVVRGWALAVGGQAGDGLAELRRGLAAWQATGAQSCVPYFLALAAAAHAAAGQPDEALSRLAAALERAGRSGERWFEAELHRLRGEYLLSSPEPEPAEAEACFRQALEIAHAQGARTWVLRAATSLARLWRDQERRPEAYDLLAPVYGWFTEGFATPDLQDAKTLLDELS